MRLRVSRLPPFDVDVDVNVDVNVGVDNVDNVDNCDLAKVDNVGLISATLAANKRW